MGGLYDVQLGAMSTVPYLASMPTALIIPFSVSNEAVRQLVGRN